MVLARRVRPACYQRTMLTLLKWLIGALVVFGGFVAFMYVAQRSMMYFPDTLRTTQTHAGFADAQEVVLNTSDIGEKVIAWHLPPRGDKPVVLYFHGNGGSAPAIASTDFAR